VNGLNTSKSEAIEQSRELSRKLNREVVLHYNPESNVVFDLVEAVWGRWFGRFIPTKFVRNLKHSIMQLLLISTHPAVMLIGHSQGCLHVMNAVNQLPEKRRTHIYVVLFASPTIYEASDLFKVEYFYNDSDWVVSDLVRHWQKDRRKVYVRESQRHDLIHGYLEHIDRYKRFDGKYSLFTHMCRVGEIEREDEV